MRSVVAARAGRAVVCAGLLSCDVECNRFVYSVHKVVYRFLRLVQCNEGLVSKDLAVKSVHSFLNFRNNRFISFLADRSFLKCALLNAVFYNLRVDMTVIVDCFLCLGKLLVNLVFLNCFAELCGEFHNFHFSNSFYIKIFYLTIVP